MEQERLQQEERERRYREREEQIEEHRQGATGTGTGTPPGSAKWHTMGAGAQGCARPWAGVTQGWALAEDAGGNNHIPGLPPLTPVPCLCRRKQQSLEAEEAQQRLKEPSIFVSAVLALRSLPPACGSGAGELGLPCPQGCTGQASLTCLNPRRGTRRRTRSGSSSRSRSRRWR